jgi:hypothetical protein
MTMTSESKDALTALTAYREATRSRGPQHVTIADLLTDLLHLAEREGLDALSIANQSRRHFLAEASQKKRAA